MHILIVVAYIGLGIVQLVAFMQGLDVWLGFGGVASIAIFVVAVSLGPIGSMAIAIIGFMGATKGWGWEWWQAGLLCFPFVALSFATMGIFGVAAMIKR